MFDKLTNEVEEIYESRSILKSLVIKNLFGRYRNSFLGFVWHFIMPMVLLFVYYVVFSQIRATPIPNFWVYLASGLFPFNFMINNLVGGSSCIVTNAGMVKKMYFPREILVLSQVVSTFVIMVIGYVIIISAVIISGFGLDVSFMFLPVIFILTFIFTLGLVFVFSALTVYVRDVQHILSSFSMMFFFLTPMYFIADSVTGIFRTIVSLNPFTYFVEAYHDIIFYQTIPSAISLVIIFSLSSISLAIGVFVFCKLKNGFAERL